MRTAAVLAVIFLTACAMEDGDGFGPTFATAPKLVFEIDGMGQAIGVGSIPAEPPAYGGASYRVSEPPPDPSVWSPRTYLPRLDMRGNWWGQGQLPADEEFDRAVMNDGEWDGDTIGFTVFNDDPLGPLVRSFDLGAGGTYPFRGPMETRLDGIYYEPRAGYLQVSQVGLTDSQPTGVVVEGRFNVALYPRGAAGQDPADDLRLTGTFRGALNVTCSASNHGAVSGTSPSVSRSVDADLRTVFCGHVALVLF